MTEIPVVSRTVAKGLVKELKDLEIRGLAETVLTTALLRSARILRRDLRRLAITKILEKNHQLTLV